MVADNEPDGFGSYLATVHERDIDLLLMEEFHVSPEFVTWFATLAGVAQAKFDGAWHSVTNADGETDLLVRVKTPAGRVGILIENKISAAQQSFQAERYHLRAAHAQHAGKFDSYITCIAAPAGYLAGLSADIPYNARITYESIADWYSAISDARHEWRAAIMRDAVRQGRRGYTMVVNDTVTRFHQDFWNYLVQHEPLFAMHKPTPKGSGSSWIRFKGLGFPPGREFALKLDQEIIELGFYRCQVEELRALDVNWPARAVLRQKGQTAAVHLSTPPLNKTRPLTEQQDALAATMAAAHILRPFADLLLNRRA